MRKAFLLLIVVVSAIRLDAYTNNVQPGGVVRAADVVELRTAANALRATAGLQPYTFTDPSLAAGATIRRVHVAELRTAIDAARAALAMPPVTYTDSTLTTGATRVKALHITELRAAAQGPGGPTNPAASGGRRVLMQSPTLGETFWSPTTSLRLVAHGFDPNVFTNFPVDGKGQNAAQVDFYVDNTHLLTVMGIDAEYSVFKGYVNNVALTPGQHLVWARATYVSPALVLDSAPHIITVQNRPTYGQTVDLAQDVILGVGNPTYSLQGTANAPVRLNGNGFKIRGTGTLTLRYVDVSDLGSRTDGLASAIDVSSSTSVVIENSTFDTSGQVTLNMTGTATASIKGNTFRSNSRVSIGQLPYEPDTSHIVEISGNSTGAKTFAENNVAAAAVGLTNARFWTLDSNVLIGARCAYEVQNSANITIEGNFVRNVYYGGWSQGQLMELHGSTPITVRHNILIGSSWPVRGIAGELAYNVIADGGHESVVPDANANIHHNLFIGCGDDGGDCNGGIVGGIYDVPNVRVTNNTIDALGRNQIVAAVYIQQNTATVRSNAFYNIPTLDNVPSAAIVDYEPGAGINADYNAFHGARLKNYSDNSAPAHDVVGRPNPNFTGPLPASPFDMDQMAVWTRQLSVGALLADYRARYMPAPGSPLIDAGDPAGGAGNDIGAIGAGAANANDLFGTFSQASVEAPASGAVYWSSAAEAAASTPVETPAGPSRFEPPAREPIVRRAEAPRVPVKIEPLVVYSNVVQPGAIIRAVDILETRTAANELRSAAGLAPYTFTQPSPGGMLVRALHINELRTAVDEARAALGLTAMTYTDATIVPGITSVKAAHLTELRTAVVLPGGSALLNPTTPQNFFAAGISPTKVFLKWSPSVSPTAPAQTQKTISSYRIYRDGAQIATINTATSGALRFEDSGRTPNTTYTYTVAAFDSAGVRSPSINATATTLPTMPVGGTSTHPVLFPAGKLASLAAGGAAWNSLKQYCDSKLNTILGAGYAGWDWHDAEVNYSTCYQVAKLQGDTTNAQKYAKKALALAIVLARHHNQGTPSDADQPIGFTNGATTTFPIPFTPVNTVAVKLVATREIAVVRTASSGDSLNAFAPIMKIATSPGGAAAYAPTDYELRYRNGLEVWQIAWLGANKPSQGSTYYVTVADGNATNVGAANYTVNAPNLTLTFNAPPAANNAVMVSYLGTNYEQTGNGIGGVNSVQPDGPGYPMRTFNPGLATAYDALYDSSLLTPALKTEFYTVMNKQVDWCTNYCYENNGTGGEVGNYFIRGLFGGTFATAYATDGENPLAAQLKTQANTQLAQVYEGVVKVMPGGYGPQGQYANGTTNDILELMSLYRDVTGLDLIARLDWTNTVVPATIHGTKPDLQTFYDGGDWDDLPATPLDAAMQAFLQYQPNHTNAPFARKLVQELGQTPASPGTVTDYRNAYGLSFFGQAAPFYARGSWTSGAVWMSLTSNDTGAVAHQHRDAGHITINRGTDYLLKNAGGYDYTETLYHNTLLIDDRNIAGYTPVIVYPPGQGWWGQEAQLTKHADAGLYAYAQADIAPAYINNDGVRNSVKRGLRSTVFLRPGTIVVFDQIQTAHASIKKTFNANFGGTLTNQGSGIWSTTVGQSKLFVQPLLTTPTPVVTSLPGGNNTTSSNFQETITGNLKDIFLHVFEATSSATASMTAGRVMKSVDRNVQGVEVAAGSKTWAVLFAAYDRAFAGNVQYMLPTAGAHSHLMHDLLPLNAYVVSITNAQGQLIRMFQATTDQNGVLAFDTPNGETYFYVSPGTTSPGGIPAVVGDPNV